MNRWSDDRGVVSILVTMLVAGGLLMGLLAMVIDGGRAFNERRLVQNGADAAVLAVAQACALDPELCPVPAVAARAGDLANLNAGPDGVSALEELCGSGDLGACQSLSNHMWECQSPAPFPNYARVRTATLERDGATILPPIFSRAIGVDGTGLWACAQATWGSARSALVTFPIALSACDYQSDTSAVIEIFKEPTFVPGQGPTCTIVDADGNMQTLTDAVNGFFYVQLDANRRDCETPVEVSIGDFLDRSLNIVQLCGSRYEQALQRLVGKQSALPIFDQISPGGLGTAQMRVASFVAFQLQGIRFRGGGNANAAQAGQVGVNPPGGWPAQCRANNVCIYGVFGRAVSGGGVDPDAPNLGLQSVQLIP